LGYGKMKKIVTAPPAAPVSLRALARQIGRGESTVRKWTSRPDWPFARGPFDVDEIQRWMQIHLRRDPAQRYHDAQKGIGPRPLSEIDKARAWNYLEAAKIRRMKREQAEGKLHDVAGCLARRRRQILAVRNSLTRTLPRTLAAELVGRARGDAERIIHDRLAAVCEAFAKDDTPDAE